METKQESARDEGVILLVDDDASIREAIGEHLTVCGFRVLLADSYDSAVHVLKTADQEIETILCDIKMPGKSGHYVLRYVTENTLNVPLIFLTGVATLESCQEAVKDGAIDYLLKPIEDTQVLITALRRGVDRYRADKLYRQTQFELLKTAEQHCDTLDALLSDVEEKDIVLDNLIKITEKWKSPPSK